MATGGKRPWRMLVPLAMVLIIAISWSIYWTVASATIRKAYGNGERRLSAMGISLACDEAHWSGFPFRVERYCRAPKVSIDRPGERVAISAANLLFAVQVYEPRHAVALLDGPTVTNGLVLGEIDHGRALASLRVWSDEQWQASIELPKVAVGKLGKAERLLAYARETGDGNADVAISAEKLEVKLADGSTLPIDRLDIAATLPKQALAENVARYLATTGKQVSIGNVSAEQGELMLTASGAVSIDNEGYPTGRISTRISRVDLLLKMIQPVAKLSDSDVATAKTVIGLLQKGSGSKEVLLDVIAKDRKLYFGPFKIARLQPLF